MVKIIPTIKYENRSSRVLSPCLPTFSYHKLPQQLLNLSLLKLDGSSFDVHVPSNATVAELKLAVEGVFSLLPKECQANISWSHVWSHFCMCHKGQKLVDDKAYIRSLGIKDGDQLQFIRHMSINYKPTKQQSKKQIVTSSPCSVSSSESNVLEAKKLTSVNDHDNIQDQENNSRYFGYEEEEIPIPEFKMARILQGWLPYVKFWSRTSNYRTRFDKVRF